MKDERKIEQQARLCKTGRRQCSAGLARRVTANCGGGIEPKWWGEYHTEENCREVSKM